MPIFDDLYPSQLQDDSDLEMLPEQKYDMASVAMILHSSGMVFENAAQDST